MKLPKVHGVIGRRLLVNFRVEDADDHVSLQMQSADGRVRVEVAGRPAPALPPTSIFGTVEKASAFFEPGSVGSSVTASGQAGRRSDVHLSPCELALREIRVASLESR